MFPERMWSRRSFLRYAASLTAGVAIRPWHALGQQGTDSLSRSEEAEYAPKSFVPDFIPGHIRYKGGRWQEYPSSLAVMLEEVRTRTSIETGREARVLTLSDQDLFDYPFLYISGRYEFEMPAEAEIERLRRHLTYGGFLLVDDGLGYLEEGFGQTVRELIRRMFPRNPLEPLPSDHAVFRSYYLARTIGGRQSISQGLEGIQLGSFTPLVLCRNDLGGAWARRPDDTWVEECRPGGEAQRRAAFQLGVNIALYSMTGNYKQDLIHHPIIQRRLNQG